MRLRVDRTWMAMENGNCDYLSDSVAIKLIVGGEPAFHLVQTGSLWPRLRNL
jgi:hypothetical protein